MGFYPRSSHQALLEAVISGREDLAQAALDAGGNPNRSDSLGDTPVLYAAALGHVGMLDLLMQRGGSLAKLNAQGDTFLHAAARQGMAAIFQVDALVRWGVPSPDLEQANADGETPWSLALAHVQPQTARALAALGSPAVWQAQPEVAARRLHQALRWGLPHLQAVLSVGASRGWDVHLHGQPSPWDALVGKWPELASTCRPEGAPVVAFRRRRTP